MDGFFGLYRGLLPRILGGTVGNVVQSLTAEVSNKVSGFQRVFDPKFGFSLNYYKFKHHPQLKI